MGEKGFNRKPIRFTGDLDPLTAVGGLLDNYRNVLIPLAKRIAIKKIVLTIGGTLKNYKNNNTQRSDVAYTKRHLLFVV